MRCVSVEIFSPTLNFYDVRFWTYKSEWHGQTDAPTDPLHNTAPQGGLSNKYVAIRNSVIEQAVRVATPYSLAPLLPSGQRSASCRRSDRRAYRRNLAAVSHAQYVPTLTASAAVRKRRGK